MDLLWGTKDAIPLEDPLYDIFLHVMVHGSLAYSIVDSRKFLLKLAGLREKFTPEMLVSRFRGIISKHVKDLVAKIMINGKLSYFMISANLMDISDVLQERIGEIFDQYGIRIEFFNVETISVPKADYDAVSKAKERRTSRLIEGYTWQEERQMMIAEKFASNEGTMGNVGGAVGGFMMGGALGGSIVDIARNALDPDRIPKDTPPRDAAGTHPRPGKGPSAIDVNEFFKPKEQPEPTAASEKCPKCGADLPANAKFCLTCGERIQNMDKTVICPSCGKTVPKGKFCLECGHKFAANSCPNCGAELPAGAKFCLECGERL